jgi:hypothetical protein
MAYQSPIRKPDEEDKLALSGTYKLTLSEEVGLRKISDMRLPG